MATLVKPLSHMFERSTKTNLYHGEADVLSADLEQPLHEKVRPRAQVKLYERGEGDYYQFKYAEPFRADGIFSYQSGYAQVGAHKCCPSHGFATLTTAVVEGLNILDVVTADRVVGQICGEHLGYEQVPSYSFLGTRFDNLRIAGKKVEVATDLNILGSKPAGDGSYFDEKSVTDKMRQQYRSISSAEGLPDWVSAECPEDRDGWRQPNELRCSVVDKVDYQRSFGHMIDLSPFGRIFLGELKLEREADPDDPDYYYYTAHLEMVRVELGCPAKGRIHVVVLESQGGGSTTPNPNPGPGQGPGPVAPAKHKPA